MCTQQKVQALSMLQNLSILSLFVILGTGAIIILLSWTLEACINEWRTKRKKGNYERLQWILDGKLQLQLPQNMPQDAISTAGIPWTDSSLQQLLFQPAVEMQFLEDAVRDTYSQGLYRHDLNSGG
ncbi:hypothetical protein N7471_014053 [Penicillium samsonianum]|uniref:uncharacterized protein n=1 Tax=Penicillium samsonianum TaxID=1882272 RepID=UPI002548A3F1|nr:uncharacterized protein N7471_014053 [Penicillium samsonianum]KAJ6118176.1 hypothetical protein N7471_014053 [Penicillium samsonianum]